MRVFEKELCERFLFFNFFMNALNPAPFAVLFELNLSLYFLSIFTRPVVNAFTVFTGQFYKSVLGHTDIEVYSRPLYGKDTALTRPSLKRHGSANIRDIRLSY